MGRFTGIQKTMFAFAGLFGISLYPAVIYPYLHPEEYREMQKLIREGQRREDIQPGGMRVWSDPFQEKPREESIYLQRKREERAAQAAASESK